MSKSRRSVVVPLWYRCCAVFKNRPSHNKTDHRAGLDIFRYTYARERNFLNSPDRRIFGY